MVDNNKFYKNNEELENAVRERFSDRLQEYEKYVFDYGAIMVINKKFSYSARIVTCKRCKEDNYKSILYKNFPLEQRNSYTKMLQKNDISFKGDDKDIILYKLINDKDSFIELTNHDVYMNETYIIIDNKEKLFGGIEKIIDTNLENKAKTLENTNKKIKEAQTSLKNILSDIDKLKTHRKNEAYKVNIIRNLLNGFKSTFVLSQNMEESESQIDEWYKIDKETYNILKKLDIVEDDEQE